MTKAEQAALSKALGTDESKLQIGDGIEITNDPCIKIEINVEKGPLPGLDLKDHEKMYI